MQFTDRSNGVGVGRFSRTCSTNSFCVRPQYLTQTMAQWPATDIEGSNRTRM